MDDGSMNPSLPFELFINHNPGVPGIVVLPERGFRSARDVITSWPDYARTPLRDLDAIAADLGICSLSIKDEATRFGLGSFKALGGAYAVARVIAAEADRRDNFASRITVTCATDGNHGRSVAWGAQRFGCGCVIYVHETVSEARVAAIAAFGAEVRPVPGNYDDAVRASTLAAQENRWHIVSDTSWEGYVKVPVDVMQGYRLMADEAADQWEGPPPTHVFIQGGVGGVAAAVCVHMRARFSPAPSMIVVEPDKAACLLASAKLGRPTAIRGDLDTIMAGLACGEPSLLAWQELARGAAAFMAVPDEMAVSCMRLLAGQGMVSGESGVAGLAGLLLAAGDPGARAALALGPESRVLLFSTEGATDPDLYRKLVGDD